MPVSACIEQALISIQVCRITLDKLYVKATFEMT